MKRTDTRVHLDLATELQPPRPAETPRLVQHAGRETAAHAHRRERHAAHQHLHDVARGAEPDEERLGA